MPWKESSRMDEKKAFVEAVRTSGENHAELCRRFGISRQTGYNLLARHQAEGEEGLRDRSRAPRHKPQSMSEEVRDLVLALRGSKPSWGPKKLKAHLERQEKERQDKHGWAARKIPARSSIGDLLKREGLAVARRKRMRSPLAQSEPLAHAVEANRVWSIDYKGHFCTGDGKRCDPLTITDNYSRYLLRLTATPRIDLGRARAILEAAFREFGMPEAIRSDNGTPFAGAGPGGLTRLSLWWEKLGIHHERIEPGEPQQNGRHERMHLSLVRDCLARGVAADWRAQQRVFMAYVREFNHERPHEALDFAVPADCFVPSPRVYTGYAADFEYGAEYQTRRVYRNGCLLWGAERVPVSPVLAGERLGLREESEDTWAVYCGRIFLGWLDGYSKVFIREDRAVRWARKLPGGESEEPEQREQSA